MYHCLQLDVNNNNCLVCYFSVHEFLLEQKQLLDNYLTDLCNGDLQTTINLFKHPASLHKTNWTSLTHLPALNCCRRMFVIPSSRNLYNLNIIALVYYCSVVCIRCFWIFVYLFTIFLCWCLLLYEVVLYCLQIGFVSNFNLRQFKSKSPVSRFFTFVAILWKIKLFYNLTCLQTKLNSVLSIFQIKK